MILAAKSDIYWYMMKYDTIYIVSNYAWNKEVTYALPRLLPNFFLFSSFFHTVKIFCQNLLDLFASHSNEFVEMSKCYRRNILEHIRACE